MSGDGARLAQTSTELRELVSAARSRRHSIASGGALPGGSFRAPGDAVIDFGAPPDVVHRSVSEVCGPAEPDVSAMQRLFATEAVARHELLLSCAAASLAMVGPACAHVPDGRWADLCRIVSACGAPELAATVDVNAALVATATACARLHKADARYAGLRKEAEEATRSHLTALSAAQRNASTSLAETAEAQREVNSLHSAATKKLTDELGELRAQLSAAAVNASRLQADNDTLATELLAAQRELTAAAAAQAKHMRAEPSAGVGDEVLKEAARVPLLEQRMRGLESELAAVAAQLETRTAGAQRALDDRDRRLAVLERHLAAAEARAVAAQREAASYRSKAEEAGARCSRLQDEVATAGRPPWHPAPQRPRPELHTPLRPSAPCASTHATPRSHSTDIAAALADSRV